MSRSLDWSPPVDDEYPEAPPWFKALSMDVLRATADAMSVVERKAKADLKFLEAIDKRDARVNQKLDRIIASGTGTARDIQELRGDMAEIHSLRLAVGDAKAEAKLTREDTQRHLLVVGEKPTGKIGALIFVLREYREMKTWKAVALIGLLFIVSILYIVEKFKAL